MLVGLLVCWEVLVLSRAARVVIQEVNAVCYLQGALQGIRWVSGGCQIALTAPLGAQCSVKLVAGTGEWAHIIVVMLLLCRVVQRAVGNDHVPVGAPRESL